MEKKLQRLWDAGNPIAPTLRSIEISGGLRGISELQIPFRYPITAICGTNGAGKSTVLALSALAFHSPEGWYVHRGHVAPRKGARSYYVFSDFFVQGDGDRNQSNVVVTWRYGTTNGEQSVTFSKARTWGRYSRRPERQVDFVPLGRLMPAHEIAGMRTAFAPGKSKTTPLPLSAESRRRLSYIMGREYSAADVRKSQRWRFPRCDSDGSYTAFNMGGGESCMIALLDVLERLGNGGLLVVEEVEAGLHPEAQHRLAEVLIRVCYEKKMQIICSTHSETFLDALPRQARLLLTRSRSEHVTFERPSSRFAFSALMGNAQVELVIYCEDRAAKHLIEASLPHDLRMRVDIRDIGSDATVARQGVCHMRSGHHAPAMCVFDGDVSESQVKDWFRSEHNGDAGMEPELLILPGEGKPPELWVLDQLKLDPYESALATELGCATSVAKQHVDAMTAQLDHHSIAYSLSSRTRIDENNALRILMRAVAPRHPQLEQLREHIADLLSRTA